MQWGSWGSSQVATSESGLLLCCQGNWFFSQVARGSWASSRIEGELAVPLKSLQGNQTSCSVEGENSDFVEGNSVLLSGCDGISVFLSSCNRRFRLPLELRRGTWGSSRVAAGVLGLLLSCSGELGVPLSLWQEIWGFLSSGSNGTQSSSCMMLGTQHFCQFAVRDSRFHSNRRRD